MKYDKNHGGSLMGLLHLCIASTIILLCSAVHCEAEGTAFSANKIDTYAEQCSDLDVAYINGDGHLDIVACSARPSLSSSSGHTLWLENDGKSPPTFLMHWVHDGDIGNHYAIEAADLDSDGDQDVITNHPSSAGDLIWYENGGGLQPTFMRHVLDTPTTSTAGIIRAADFNNDGQLDIAVDAGGKIIVYLISSLRANPIRLTQQIVDQTGSYYLQVADLNGDDRPDLLFYPGDYVRDEITWYENRGGNSIVFNRNKIVVAAGQSAGIVKILDVDRDKRLDILVQASGAIRLLRNLGGPAPNFEQSLYATVPAPLSIQETCDLNGNGKMDFVGYDHVPVVKLNWYENYGKPSDVCLPHMVENTIEDSIDPIIAADLNGDGDLDLVALKTRSGAMQPFEGKIIWYGNNIHRANIRSNWAFYK